MRLKLALALLASASACGAAARCEAATRPLDIYFIDVEGGQSTLLVTPDKQSYLIDTGWAGGTQPSSNPEPGDPAKARDANRIVAAARDAGVKQIDYLMITHFHPDHDGGVVELSKLMPIRHFIDHDTLLPEAQKDAGTKAAYERYLEVSRGQPHIVPKPGDRLPLTGIEAVVVSSAGSVLTQPLPGAGGANSLCGSAAVKPNEALENPRSTGVIVTLGKFRFLDVGDLTGEPLFKLACPQSLIGPVDVYLAAHHGGTDTADPALYAAFKPRVVVMNNGLKKGGGKNTYEALHHVTGLADVWQIHRSEAAAEQNFAADHIANLDESTGYWIKLSARADGSFTVVNGRTGQGQSYPAGGR
jgi:competence protein ComEC